MKDDNKGLFNAPEPIFTQSPDQFEDIAAPLTAGMRVNYTAPSGYNFNADGMTIVNGELHLSYLRFDSVSQQNINDLFRYNTSGTVLGSSTRISRPTGTPSGRTGATFSAFGPLAFYNNKYYIITYWNVTGQLYWGLSIYSSSLVFESLSSWTIFRGSSSIPQDLDINNNILVYTIRDGNGFRAINLTSGSQLACISGTGISFGIAFSDTRIYAYSDERFRSGIRAYNTSYNRVTADDTSGNQVNYMSISGGNLYGITSGDIYPYSGVPLPAAPSITASWSSPSYRSFSRSIVSTVSFTGDPRMFDVDDFEVQEQNVQGSWVEASTGTWTVTATGTGMSRVVTATPNSSVAAGTYRINLPANAFEMNQPNAAANTGGRAVAAYVAPSYTWSTAAITPAQDRSVSVTMTFSVDPGMLDAEDDFEVQHRTSTGPDVWTTAPDANWALTVSGTETSRTVRAAPVQMVAAGTYRLRLKADALEADHPPDAVASPAFTIATYVAPPGVATAAWSNAGYCSTSNRIQATITFSGEKVEGLAAEDFEIITGTGGTTSGWVISLPGTIIEATEIAAGTGTLIEATAPAGQNSSFRLRLKRLSVMSDDSTTDNAPADNVETSDIQVDNRGFMPVHSVATARWTNVAGGQTLSGLLTFSGENMMGLATTDFDIYDDSDNEMTSSWTVTLPTGFNGNPVTGTPIRVVATPPANTNGSFYLRLPSLSMSSGGGTDNAPGINVDTDTLIVNNTSTADGRSTYTLQIPIPRNLKGSIQISVPAESFNVSGQGTQRGPRAIQYLGTVSVDYEIIPRVIRVEQNTEAVIGTNSVLFDFNTEVRGINADAFSVVGGPVTVSNSNIFFSATQDPDVRPDAMGRSTVVASNGSTFAKYYKVDIELTALPAEDFRLYLRDGVVNND